MIRSQVALLRMAQDFFRSDLVGFYSWDVVRIDEPQRRPDIPSDIDYRARRRLQDERAGLGKWLEQERLTFGPKMDPWEILIYSAAERPALGELILRDGDTRELVKGPLDPATWAKIGTVIRERSQST